MRIEIVNLCNNIVNNASVLNQAVLKENLNVLEKMLLLDNLTFFEKGWIYWQIQDHYALLREPQKLLKYFKKFTDFLKDYDSRYLYWSVCDGTQALTMRLGDYNRYWDEVVDLCNSFKLNDNESVRMNFEMNRAYIGVFNDVRVRISNEKVIKALDNIRKIIVNYPNHPDYFFFNLTYYALSIKYFNYVHKSFDNIIDKILYISNEVNKSLKAEEILSEYLFGSWDSIAKSKGFLCSSMVGMNNLVFALIEANRIDVIKELLNLIPNYKITNRTLRKTIENKAASFEN